MIEGKKEDFFFFFLGGGGGWGGGGGRKKQLYKQGENEETLSLVYRKGTWSIN